jgi:hypothetical protein
MDKQSTPLKKAMKDAIGGGLPGMFAMSIQVSTLMWLRTTVNYQYRHGKTTTEAFRHLYREGGIPRFYRGFWPAMLQAPLSRFGDTAANAGTLSLLDAYDSTRDLPIGIKTLAASISAASFRILLMPIDTVKTIMQVEGSNALPILRQKLIINGPSVLFNGALASSAATFVGHFPWFVTYNTMNKYLPIYKDDLPKTLIRSAFIGFCASMISDTCSNSLRVIKTTRQTIPTNEGYIAITKAIIKNEGLVGLAGRGLKTKIITNGIQGLVFSVFWKLGQDYYAQR